MSDKELKYDPDVYAEFGVQPKTRPTLKNRAEIPTNPQVEEGKLPSQLTRPSAIVKFGMSDLPIEDVEAESNPQ